MEPAIAKHLRRSLRPIPISLHHDRAADRNLTRRRRALFYRLRLHNLCFDPGKRPSHRAKHDLARRVNEGSAGGFRQAVGVQNVNAKRIEIAGDGRIESRAAGYQVAHARAEGGMNLSKENLSSIDSSSPQRTVERHQRAYQPQCQLAAFVQLFENALVNYVEKLRHNA